MSFGTPKREFRIRLWKQRLGCTTSEFRAVSGVGESNENLIPDKVYWGKYWINSRRFHSCGWPGSARRWLDMPLVTATSMSPDPVPSVYTRMSMRNLSSGVLNRAWGGKTAEGVQPNNSP